MQVWGKATGSRLRSSGLHSAVYLWASRVTSLCLDALVDPNANGVSLNYLAVKLSIPQYVQMEFLLPGLQPSWKDLQDLPPFKDPPPAISKTLRGKMRCPRNGQTLPFLGTSPAGADQGLANEPPLLVTSPRPSVATAIPLTSNLLGSWLIQNPSSLLKLGRVSRSIPLLLQMSKAQ